MQYLMLIAGLAMIVKSADVLIDSSSKIAKQYGVSSFVIGITVVAFGTSAPELAVGILSGISHTNQLTLGNIIGSAMSNTALIVGISAIIMTLRVRDSVIKREIPMLLGIQAALAAMLLIDGELSRMEGGLLLLGFVGFMLYIVKGSEGSVKIQLDLQGDIDTDGENNQLPNEASGADTDKGLIKLWLLSVLSLAGLFVGGQLTVNNSAAIAQSLGLGETLIGLTVVSIATTMPELITSMMAALKKEPEIILGNCIGSNIFNILLVLGLSSVISPIAADTSLWIDIVIMLSLTSLIFVISWRNKQINRREGIAFVMLYIAYLTFKVLSAV